MGESILAVENRITNSHVKYVELKVMSLFLFLALSVFRSSFLSPVSLNLNLCELVVLIPTLDLWI